MSQVEEARIHVGYGMVDHILKEGRIDLCSKGTRGTHIERHVHTYHITRPQKLLKPHIFGASAQFIAQPASVVILHLHPQRLSLLLEVPPDPSHAQDPYDFTLGIMAERWRSLATEFTFAQVHERGGEHAEGTEHEEEGGVGGGCVDGGGDVGHMDTGFCAVGNVALVVSGAWFERSTNSASLHL